ncbi:MAG: hypothetical protein LBS56_02350 [Propionibacteriaceae bacterium]|jgi:hypothetical protein|nr:hypothetical protein [Propionibacteriaceae bacterium]
MSEEPWSDRGAAATAVGRLTTSAADLMAIALAQPDLGVDVALHPNAYPGLLDWLDDHGRPAVKDAVARRRQTDAAYGPVPPPGRPDSSPAAPGAAPPAGAAARLRAFAPPTARPTAAPGPPAPAETAPASPRPKSKFPPAAVVIVGVAAALVVGGVVFAFRDALFGPGPAEPDVAAEPPDSAVGLEVKSPPSLTSGLEDVPTPPYGLPACPAGLWPVAWTRHSDGHVLVCGSVGGDFWAAVRQGGQDLEPTKLTFTDDGWTVECGGGTGVAVTLEGGLVDVTGSDPGTHGARGALIGHDEVDFSEAGKLRPCPAGSHLLSLSTWNGGWLTVCGAAADAPTSAAWSAAGGGETTSVIAQPGGGYCADRSGLKACVYASPALVVFTGAGSDRVQHSVTDNWFEGVGRGGAGRGTGSYGVPAPKDTDADQVRYLVDLLDASSGARGKLGPAVTATAQCDDVAAQIVVMESIAQNRRDLLAALETTPVDLIAGGTGLVARLEAALRASLGSDESYLAWAQEMRATGCAVGSSSSHYQAAAGYDQQATAAKSAFVSTWNSVIAPMYGVATFAESQI